MSGCVCVWGGGGLWHARCRWAEADLRLNFASNDERKRAPISPLPLLGQVNIVISHGLPWWLNHFML